MTKDEIRDRLIELIGGTPSVVCNAEATEALADHLIANGVTFAEDTNDGRKWIRYDDVQEGAIKYICPNCGDYHAFKKNGGSPFLTDERTFGENYIFCRKCGKKNGANYE